MLLTLTRPLVRWLALSQHVVKLRLAFCDFCVVFLVPKFPFGWLVLVSQRATADRLYSI
jgi:hypothetical protein